MQSEGMSTQAQQIADPKISTHLRHHDIKNEGSTFCFNLSVSSIKYLICESDCKLLSKTYTYLFKILRKCDSFKAATPSNELIDDTVIKSDISVIKLQQLNKNKDLNVKIWQVQIENMSRGKIGQCKCYLFQSIDYCLHKAKCFMLNIINS